MNILKDDVNHHEFNVAFLFPSINSSPINRSSARESAKVKTSAAEKASTGGTAARAETKGRGTPDHGEMFKVCLI